jgi:hypothetical protein
MYSRCYATREYTATVSEQRHSKHFPSETNKHVNNIRDIARQPPITTIEELLRAVFSVGSDPDLHNEDPKPAH